MLGDNAERDAQLARRRKAGRRKGAQRAEQPGPAGAAGEPQPGLTARAWAQPSTSAGVIG